MQEEQGYKWLAVVPLGQPELRLCVPEQSTVGQLKEVVERELNVPASRQSFVGMEDDALVVPEGARLELRVSLRGGCGVECCGCTWYGPCVKKDCGSCDFYFPCSIM